VYKDLVKKVDTCVYKILLKKVDTCVYKDLLLKRVDSRQDGSIK